MIQTKHARSYIDHADRLFTETYPITQDPKLFIPTLKLLCSGLELIGTDGSAAVLGTVTPVLDAYASRVVEFPRGSSLVFADDAMHTTSVSPDVVAAAIEETKRAYSEAYE